MRRARSSEPRKMVVENDDLEAELSSSVAAAVEVLRTREDGGGK